MKKLLSILLMTGSVLTAGAADFFSTDAPERDFTFGVRLGVNTTNRTVSHDAMPGYNVQSWGTGFDLGAVVDLYFKQYFSLQPGIYLQTRAGNYTFVTPVAGDNYVAYYTQAGHRSSANLTVPVMGSFHFNVCDEVRWDAEIGPYVQFGLGSKLKNKSLTTTAGEGAYEPLFTQKANSFDFGLRFGTGLRFFDHYIFGIHYEAGFIHAWKNRIEGPMTYNYGGRNKAWTFNIGYEF